MAMRLTALFFAVIATGLFLAMAFGIDARQPGTDPQTIIGGYGLAAVHEFFAGLSLEQRQTWRTGIIYLDFPFIICCGLAGYLIFAGAHGGLRVFGLVFVYAFVFCDALEDFRLLALMEPWLAGTPQPDGAIAGEENFWLGWVTSAKFVAFLAMLLCAVPAIWQKPKT